MTRTIAFALALALVALHVFAQTPAQYQRTIDSLRTELQVEQHLHAEALRTAGFYSAALGRAWDYGAHRPKTSDADAVGIRPYLAIGLRSQAHSAAVWNGGIGLTLNVWQVGIDAGAYIEPPTARDSVKFQTVFTGGLRFYLSADHLNN